MLLKNKEEQLTTKDYWQSAQGGINISLPNTNPLYDWLNNTAKRVGGETAFEIGCYPGKFLYPFAANGFVVSGIDFLDKTLLIGQEFERKGFKVGQFYCGDFFQTSITQKYDIVTSFGFIEHFINFEEVIKRQAKLVKTGGRILIEVPNFVGIFQRIPRYIFDYKNFKRHNLKAMKPNVWIDILESLGFEIEEVGYIGDYQLWFESEKSSAFYFKSRNIVTKLLSKLVSRFFSNCDSSYSPVIVLLAKKVIDE